MRIPFYLFLSPRAVLIRCEVDSDMKESDYSVIGIGCDVSSELSVQQAFRKVMDTYGRIDSVVASAGPFSIHTRNSKYKGSLRIGVTRQALWKTTPRSTTHLTG